jgi:hypothetical protein
LLRLQELNYQTEDLAGLRMRLRVPGVLRDPPEEYLAENVENQHIKEGGLKTV